MEKKAMSASQISTISATQVSSSWSIYSIRARKRKRACDIVLPIKMDIADVHEIFRQLRFARYGQGPFSKFENWKDEHLWESLLQVIIERRSFHIHLKTVIFVILEYAKKYAKDTSVGWINDDALKSDVISVFKSEPLVDQKGCLSVEQLEVIIRNMNNTGLLADDEQVDESINSGGRNSGGRNTVKRFRGSGSTSSGERRLKCSEKFEAGNILQLTLVYRDACHALLLFFFGNNQASCIIIFFFGNNQALIKTKTDNTRRSLGSSLKPKKTTTS